MSNPVPFTDIPSEPAEWLWRERIPIGMLSVIAGRPDKGKGLVSAHIAADVSRSGGRVLYSAIEDAPTIMTKPRLVAANAELKNVLSWRFSLPSQIDELAAYVAEHEIKLVIMDPFAAHLGGVSRYSDSIRQVLTPLSEIAEENHCAILIIEHALKNVGKYSHPLQAIGGSASGLPAAARMAFIFGNDPKDADRKILACVKANIRDVPKAIEFVTDTDDLDKVGETPLLIYSGETVFDARRLLTFDEAAKLGRPPDKRAAAAEWLAMHLFSQPGYRQKAGDVIEDAKHYVLSARTVRRAADDMGILRDPPGGGRSCQWVLPPEVIELLADGADLFAEVGADAK
jgi:putative DNA primase/helicase